MSLFAKYLTKSFLHYIFTAIAHQNTGMLASWNITSRNSSFCELLFRRNISLLLCISGITVADTFLSRMFPNDKCPPKLQLYIQQICSRFSVVSLPVIRNCLRITGIFHTDRCPPLSDQDLAWCFLSSTHHMELHYSHAMDTLLFKGGK